MSTFTAKERRELAITFVTQRLTPRAGKVGRREVADFFENIIIAERVLEELHEDENFPKPPGSKLRNRRVNKLK